MTEVSQRIAVSGMLALQRQLDVIGNNIANLQTTGFKRARANLADIGYQAGLTAPVGPNGADVRLTGVGEGVQLADVRRDFLPGIAQPTGNPLDVALEGEGFMVVELPNGQPGYTRDGAFRLDAQGRLATTNGYPLRSADGGDLVEPADAEAARLDPQGQLIATVNGVEQVVGRIGLARFRNADGLLAEGQNVWLATDASGPPTPLEAGVAGAPSLVVGALEASNVDVGDEFTRLIQAQRGYQLNLKVAQAWDDVARMATELRR